MTPPIHFQHISPLPEPHWPKRTRDRIALGAGIMAFSLAVIAAVAPPPAPSAAEELQAFVEAHAQSVTVRHSVATAPVVRDAYGATPGIQTLAAGATNYDWAKMVLLLAELPITDNNVTVFTRWMRQENYVDSWWNRNNPLNNGWGSGGGGGLGSYDDLVTAARYAAEALRTNAGYAGIVEAFAADSPTAVTEAAIWASPWASGHYNNGAHWSYADVPVVQAPADAW